MNVFHGMDPQIKWGTHENGSHLQRLVGKVCGVEYRDENEHPKPVEVQKIMGRSRHRHPENTWQRRGKNPQDMYARNP